MMIVKGDALSRATEALVALADDVTDANGHRLTELSDISRAGALAQHLLLNAVALLRSPDGTFDVAVPPDVYFVAEGPDGRPMHFPPYPQEHRK